MKVQPFSKFDQRKDLVATLNTVCSEGMMRTSRFELTPAWEHALGQPDCSCHLLLIALNGDQIVGWCRLFPGDINGEAELGIGLLASARGQGVGTQMLGEAITWARSHGLARLVLTTRSDNYRALRLFARCGFVPTGRREGNWMEMALWLQSSEIRIEP